MRAAASHIGDAGYCVRRLRGVVHEVGHPLMNGWVHAHGVGVREIHYGWDAGKTVCAFLGFGQLAI